MNGFYDNLLDSITANMENEEVVSMIQSMGEKDPKLAKKKEFKKLVNAMAQNGTIEGGRDILNRNISDAQATSKVVDKNNYKTYSECVKATYEFYNSRSDYGSEIFQGILRTRVALIIGEGISFTAKKKSTEDYITKFLKLNKLDGSRAISMVRTGEMEGRNLVTLRRAEKKELSVTTQYIKASSFLWWTNQYEVVPHPMDNDEILGAQYTPKSDTESTKTIQGEKMQYVKLGGSDDRLNEAVNRIHCVLTSIENFSRAKYDLRKNNHLFAKVILFYHAYDDNDKKSFVNDAKKRAFENGVSYSGKGDLKLVDVPLGALESLKGEMILDLKNISQTVGIPIQFLAWPDLLSNRATADNLLEMTNISTKEDKLLWEEAFEEMILKSMIMAIDWGVEKNDILGEFEIKLPTVSLAMLKELIEAFSLLFSEGVISKDTYMNVIPGIDPVKEKAQIKKEEKEAIKKIEESIVIDEAGKDKEEDEGAEDGD